MQTHHFAECLHTSKMNAQILAALDADNLLMAAC